MLLRKPSRPRLRDQTAGRHHSGSRRSRTTDPGVRCPNSAK